MSHMKREKEPFSHYLQRHRTNFLSFFFPLICLRFPLISRWYSMVEKVKGYMFRPTEATEAKARPIDPKPSSQRPFHSVHSL